MGRHRKPNHSARIEPKRLVLALPTHSRNTGAEPEPKALRWAASPLRLAHKIFGAECPRLVGTLCLSDCPGAFPEPRSSALAPLPAAVHSTVPGKATPDANSTKLRRRSSMYKSGLPRLWTNVGKHEPKSSKSYDHYSFRDVTLTRLLCWRGQRRPWWRSSMPGVWPRG